MITCSHHHEEDGTCGHDGGDPCMGPECPFGMYQTDEPGYNEMPESSTCRIVEIKENGKVVSRGFQCTMPEWV